MSCKPLPQGRLAKTRRIKERRTQCSPFVFWLKIPPMLQSSKSDYPQCIHCNSSLIIRSGRTPSGNQRFSCRQCNRRSVECYSYNAHNKDISQQIILFVKEGLGIRSMARVLKISVTTVISRIKKIAGQLKCSPVTKGQSYEVDEIRTFVKRKEKLIWVVYALERLNKSVVSFAVGARTNKTLNIVLQTLILSEAKCIYTDKLKNYRYLLYGAIHKTNRFGTNHIERKNLTIRIHLIRLNRRTIVLVEA